MISNFLFTLLFSFFSSSIFSQNQVYPFTKTIDFGTPLDIFLLSLESSNQKHQTESFSCDRVAVTVFQKDVYDSVVEIVYYFYNGQKQDQGVTISGLYQITLDYSHDYDLTSDDNIVEYYALEFVDLFGIQVKKKNGKIVENKELFNDGQNPKNGIVNLDGTWWLFGRNGNVASLRFPTREHIKQGQKSRFLFKQKFSINWSCE